jgi:hypothetical protein
MLYSTSFTSPSTEKTISGEAVARNRQATAVRTALAAALDVLVEPTPQQRAMLFRVPASNVRRAMAKNGTKNGTHTKTKRPPKLTVESWLAASFSERIAFIKAAGPDEVWSALVDAT